MKRQPARELIKKILKSIAYSPKSINEIASDCGSNWESVRHYLVSLKEAGVIQENEVGNKRMFSIPTYHSSKKTGNYFDLPITEEDNQKIESIYAKIKETWLKITGKVPGRIQVHKTLARVNKRCKLNLPLGWYLFGPVCVKPYEPQIEYHFSKLEPNIVICIDETVKEYSTENSSYALKLRCYNEENKTLYQTKEIILSLFSSNFSKNNSNEIVKQLYGLMGELPSFFDSESKELVNKFVGLVIQLLNSLPEQELLIAKNDLTQTFNEIWKLIALFEYFSDLEPYYIKNFSKEIELEKFATEINIQKLEVKEHLLYLNDLIPIESEPTDENYLKLKRLVYSIEEKEESSEDEEDQDKLIKKYL